MYFLLTGKVYVAVVIYFMDKFIIYFYDVSQNLEWFPRVATGISMTEFILSKQTLDILINITVFSVLHSSLL